MRSFARIHETNLKKQGMLPLTFADPADYDKVARGRPHQPPRPRRLAPGVPLTLVPHHADGREDRITLKHTFNAEPDRVVQGRLGAEPDGGQGEEA